MFKIKMDGPPLSQLFIAVFLALTSVFLLTLISMPIAYWLFGPNGTDFQRLANYTDPSVLPLMQYYQIVQSVGLFVIPPFILAYLFSSSIAGYLNLNRKINYRQILLVIVIIFSVMPLINLLANFNSQIQFPDWMSSVEHSFKQAEETAEKQTIAFMSTKTQWGLALNIFMVGVLPAIGEELMFRGILQKLFTNITRNAHWGIIISSFIFSAIHLQFYGFFPRWLLGMLFGYMLFWSGSMWAPMLAHFLNNSLAVIGYFMVNTNKLDKSTMDAGSSTDVLPYTIVATLFFGFMCYYFYSVSKKE